MSASHHTITLAAVAGLAVGCGPEDSKREWEGVWEGRHVTIVSDQGVRPCGGAVAFLDDYVEHVYDYWTEGEPVPDDLGFTLELRRSDSDGPSGVSGRANFERGTTWAISQSTVWHEMVHLVVGGLDGRSAPSLTEGVATAISGSDLSIAAPNPFIVGDLQPEDYVFLPQRTNEEFWPYYTPSAQVVRFLIQRHGVGRVREAYQTARHTDDSAQIEQAFVEVFGDSLYDDFDEFVDGPQCELQAWECSDMLEERSFPVYIDDRAHGCEQSPGLIGAVADGDPSWGPSQRFVIEVHEPTWVAVDITDNASVRRLLCLSECTDYTPEISSWWDDVPMFDIDTPFETLWPPGRYTVTVRSYDSSQPFSASLTVIDEP